MGVCSLSHDIATSYRLGHTPCFLKLTPTCTCNTAIRMHPYAHPQHVKVLKHFVYIQYGCGMQSMGVCSLNHDTAASYRLGRTPFSLKSWPWMWMGRSSSPVSKNKYEHTASELLNHLCKVVIPLQKVKEVPSEAPIKLPTRPDSYTLGTKSADLLELDDAVYVGNRSAYQTQSNVGARQKGE
jgi:hypothetical protein